MNKVAVGLFALLVGGIFAFPAVYSSTSFKINCEAYLKRAADAPTIALAKPELDKAIKYAEANNLTSGSTHMIIPDPSCDLSYWYAKLTGAREDLETVSEEAYALERSNVLMKLRETLVDEDGSITCPTRISFYPYAWLIVIFLGCGITMMAFGAGTLGL